MTSEEIEVNEYLAEAGVDVVETDLGEWVLQLAEEAPSHIVAPAIHKSRAAIAALFRHCFDPEDPPETAEELTQFARERLGALIASAEVGMTGANFITADTGTLALVTSEGNARKTALVPPTYIAVAGVEKIIPTVEDLQPFVELIGRAGTGQDITSYVSLLTPPFPSPPVDFSRPDASITSFNGSERAFHLVLIDNGRMAMRDDPQLKETLYCIRCGACANVCANFQQVGGHAFGGKTYAGGIATGWEAGVHGLDVASSFNDLCTGCTRCVPACPVQIDIPWINVVVRERINRSGASGAFDWLVEGLRPNGKAERPGLQKRLVAHFETLARWGSRTAPLSNWIARQAPVRVVMEQVFGIDRRRPLPAFQRTTFQQWFAQRTPPHHEASDSTSREVVLYPDAYTNYVRPERGKAAVRALEALGMQVHCPAVGASGRAPLSQGLITTATKKAEAVWEALADHVRAGHDIVVIEPSDLAMFLGEYEKLLPEASAQALRERSCDIMAYIARRLREDGKAQSLRMGDGQAVAYHSHCQQRTLGLERPTVSVLETLGYDVMTSDGVECCGMAGSFGYKQEYYELSMQAGEALRAQFAPVAADGHIVAASGTSCQEQLEALLGGEALHPIEIIAPGA